MDSEVRKRAIPTLYGSIKAIPKTDATLTKEGYAADAKAVGDILRNEQRAVNFSYDSNGNGLKAETIQEALDELNENNKAATERIEDVEGDIDEISSRLTPTEVKTKNSSVRSDGAGEVLLSITDRNNDTHERYLSISDKTKKGFLADSLKYVERDGDNYAVKNIFGEHNKPTGSYTGNGSATTRTIDVGGTGGWLGFCSGSYKIGIITQNGAMVFNTTNSTVKCFPVSQAKYMSGVLTISSADDLLNGNGNAYHYQVL